ncbi:hypothetical protein [Streptomyces sp. GESEQ-35]|uniref:hypothetical protein n=1 Tax=Streptomyces sp. GESEQ-35 TaxID=2812657 RepID=UPI001B33ECDB|nr:hypothetical protein [Streptomyces sp. GESEQ-35]
MNDDELLARLKAADPALTPTAPLPDINRLVEATLTTDTTPQSANTAVDNTTHPAKTTAGRGRRRLFGLAAAAALLVLGGVAAGGIMANDDNGHGTSANPLVLTNESGSAGQKCREPLPDNLREYPTLFEGTVTSVQGSSVTFRVDHWLIGDGTDTVVLDSGADQPESLTFVDGEHYIVAADKDGVVPPCGANSASTETMNKFRQAYGK